jgi:uncharacterized membrane protein
MIRAALVAVALVAAVWGVLHVGWYRHGQIVDYGVYQQYGDKVVNDHAVPYRDFQLEYPPGALPVFVAPALLERFDYRNMFQLLMAACLVGAILAAFAISGPWAAVLTAVAPLALGSVVVSRFDLWPAALTVLALAAVLRRHWALSAVLIGTAFAAKLWPAVLIPLVAIWIARSEGGRAAGRWLAIAGGTAAAWFLPFAILSPGGVAHSFHAQFARPLQLESLGASLLIAWHYVVGTPLFVESSYGSQNLIGPGTHTMAIVTSVVGVLALAAIYVAFARRTSEVGDLLRYAVAAVAVTVAFGKVFSPQFLVWLIPLVPLVRGRRGLWATSLFFAALVLTQLWFPERYWQLANHFALVQSRELLARNLAVVALAVVLVRRCLEHDVLGEHRARVEALERVRAEVE